MQNEANKLFHAPEYRIVSITVYHSIMLYYKYTIIYYTIIRLF